MESGKFTKAESSAWLEAWMRGWGQQERGGRGEGHGRNANDLFIISWNAGVPEKF